MMKDPFEVLYVLLAGFFYILFAGAHAFFYTLSKMKNEEKYKYIGYSFVGGFLYCAYVLTTNGIFDPFWKWLIAIATFVYVFIPYGMWKVVIKIHKYEEELKKKAKGTL